MKINTLLAGIGLAAMLLSGADMSAAPKKNHGKKNDTKTETKDTTARKKPSPFEKFRKDVVDSASGDFISIYRLKNDKIYIEYPKKYLGRRMLVGGTVTAVSDPSMVNIGYKYSAPVCYQVSLLDTLALLTTPNLGATTRDSSMMKALERNYIPNVVKVVPVTPNKDSSAIIFEVTSIVSGMTPKATGISAGKSSGEGKSTWYGEVKAFSDNASIVINSNVDFTRSVLGFKIPVGSGSVRSTVSFMLLPEEKMAPRVQDMRVGVFSTAAGSSPKYELTREQDGLRPYRLANRWKLEPVDSAAWMAGKLTEVKKPVVWYVDDSFPEEWKDPIRKGVLAWNKAFEKIGLKDVMQVRDFPSPEEDPEFDPDNLKYSCLRYVPNATMNAMGPSWVDPETGEILNASVMVYNDVIRLINNWRFVLTSQVDERVRCTKMPQDVIDESLVYVISHEIGHTLGLMHNMASSYAYPVDSLRSASFTAEYGTTPSIMDYARFNYVAQPGDKGVKLTPPELGIYDYYAIEWLYKPVYGASDMWEEAAVAGKLLDSHDGDPLYRYGVQQVKSTIDPSSLTEDLGDDHVKAGTYGVSNLKYVLSHLNEWITDDEDYSHRSQLYTQIAGQFSRYLGHALTDVGGVQLYQVKAEAGHLPSEAVSAATQKAALKWVISQLRTSAWLDEPSVTSHLQLAAPASNKIASTVAKQLTSAIPTNVTISCVAGSGYTLDNYYKDLYNEVFTTSIKGGKLSSEEKTIQREIMAAAAKPLIASRNKTSLTGDEAAEEELGESTTPYRTAVDISTIDEIAGYNWQLLGKVYDLAKSRRTSAPAEDRAHYEYLYRTAAAAIE